MRAYVLLLATLVLVGCSSGPRNCVWLGPSVASLDQVFPHLNDAGSLGRTLAGLGWRALEANETFEDFEPRGPIPDISPGGPTTPSDGGSRARFVLETDAGPMLLYADVEGAGGGRLRMYLAHSSVGNATEAEAAFGERDDATLQALATAYADPYGEGYEGGRYECDVGW